MSILQGYDAFFLFSFTFGANHDNPSTNPSPFTPQQAWMYQSCLRMLRKSSFSVISEGEAAFGGFLALINTWALINRKSC